MRTRPRILLPLLAAATVLVLSACSTEKAAPTPKVTTASADTTKYIGQLVDPVGTTWTGTDSGGDLSTFVLHKDHTLAVGYGTASFDERADTWSVDAGVLSLHVFINKTDGELDYRGEYDPATKSIAAVGATSLTAKKITVTLTQK
jgi:hypothetical protein